MIRKVRFWLWLRLLGLSLRLPVPQRIRSVCALKVWDLA